MFNEGDKVSFTGRRGKKVIGIIAGTHLKKRRGRARYIAQAVTGDASSLDSLMYEIYELDSNCTWRVPTGGYNLKLIEAGAVDAREARQTYNEKKTGVKAARAERAHETYNVAKDQGVAHLPLGTKIKVEFRDGNRTVYYRGIVRGSGKVRFSMEPNGKTRTTWPKYAHCIEE